MLRKAILSTLTYDPDGWLQVDLDENSTGEYQFERWGAAIRTLDGGVYIDDMGVYDAGRVFTVSTSLDDATLKTVYALTSTYARLVLAIEEGLYLVWPQTFGWKEPTAAVQFVVVRRLDNG